MSGGLILPGRGTSLTPRSTQRVSGDFMSGHSMEAGCGQGGTFPANWSRCGGERGG